MHQREIQTLDEEVTDERIERTCLVFERRGRMRIRTVFNVSHHHQATPLPVSVLLLIMIDEVEDEREQHEMLERKDMDTKREGIVKIRLYSSREWEREREMLIPRLFVIGYSGHSSADEREESDHNRSKLISPAWSVLPSSFFARSCIFFFSSSSSTSSFSFLLEVVIRMWLIISLFLSLLLLHLQYLDLCCVDRRNLFTKEKKSAYKARDRFWFNFSADNFVDFQSLRHQRRREREDAKLAREEWGQHQS